MKVASVSELKDRLSTHLDWVQAGESVIVTDRKTPVAVIGRIEPGSHSGMELDLVAGGLVAPRAERLRVEDFLALPIATEAADLTGAILEERSAGR